jgi:predicted O-methyltransferase YrrM
MMPVARTFRKELGRTVTTVYDGYLDRLSRWSDIQEYLPLMYAVARSYPGARILELGSRTGNSTLALLAGAVEACGHVTSVDIDDVTGWRNGLYAWSQIPQWTFIRGDDMDPEVQARLPAEVDVLFIDTSHEYEHTIRELEFYMPRVAPGGIALFHDTRWLPVSTGDPEGLREWGGQPPPVGRALDEYCAATGRTWTDLDGTYGMGILRP